MPLPTKLLIVDDFDNPCCPDDLEPTTVEVDVIFSDRTAHARIKLLYSKNSDTYLIPLGILQQLSSQIDEDVFDIQGFEIDNQKVSTELCASNGETRAWQEAIKALEMQTNPPTLAPKDVSHYQQSGDIWQFATAFAGRVGEDAEVATVALLSNADEGIVRQTISMGQIKIESIAQLLLQAIAYPQVLTDIDNPSLRFPKKIMTSSSTDLVLLTSSLDNLNLKQFDIDIQIEQSATAIVDEIVQDLQKAMQVPARILDGVDKETLQNYFEVTTVFYDNEYWDRVEGKRYLAFQIIKDGEAGEWHYANLMGQMGEEFGLAIFENWLEICKLESNIPSPMAMMSMMMDGEDYIPKTKREAISLTELEFLHPDDEDAVLDLDNHKEYSFNEDYPLPMSLGMGGVEAPEFSLENYTYLLKAIHEVFSKRKADVIKSIKKTVELEDCTVNLRLPAKGNEAFIDSPEAQSVGTYRFTIIGKNSDTGSISQLAKGKKVQVELSGDANAYDFTKAIKKQLNLYVEGFCIIEDEELIAEMKKVAEETEGIENLLHHRHISDEVTRVWSRNDVYSAKPFIAQIAALAETEPVYVTVWLELYELQIERISNSPRPKDDIVCIAI